MPRVEKNPAVTWVQETAHGRNFILALLVHRAILRFQNIARSNRFNPVHPAAGHTDRIDHRLAVGGAHGFSVQHHQLMGILRPQHFVLPCHQDAFQAGVIHRLKRAVKGAWAGDEPLPGILGVAAAAEHLALTLRQSPGKSGNLALPAGYAGQLGQAEQDQHDGPGMKPSAPASRVRDVGQPIHQAAGGLARQGTGRRQLGFVRRQGRRQLSGLERVKPLRVQRAHPQLFGPVMTLVEILGATAKARGRPQQHPSGRFVGGAAKQLRIDETFHRDNRMPVLPQPVRRESLTA